MSQKLALLGGKPVRTRPFPSWPIFGKQEEHRLIRTVRNGTFYAIGTIYIPVGDVINCAHET
jgi:hypothetical protein